MAWTDAKGFNFRDTLAYVTDAAGMQFVGTAGGGIGPEYPTTNTINGDSVTYGVPNSGSALGVDGQRDRTTSGDTRLAGINYRVNNATPRMRFRVDLPSAGTYSIRVAFGDPSGSGVNHYWRIMDDSTLLEAVDKTGTTISASEYWDATGVKRTSSADWVTNNAAKDYTFSSTIFFIEVGGGNVSTSTSGATSIAHLSIVASGASAVPILASTYYRMLGS